MARPTVFVCRGSHCRHRSAYPEVCARLSVVADVSDVRCQRICDGPVVGVAINGSLEWFERVGSEKAQRQIVAVRRVDPVLDDVVHEVHVGGAAPPHPATRPFVAELTLQPLVLAVVQQIDLVVGVAVQALRAGRKSSLDEKPVRSGLVVERNHDRIGLRLHLGREDRRRPVDDAGEQEETDGGEGQGKGADEQRGPPIGFLVQKVAQAGIESGKDRHRTDQAGGQHASRRRAGSAPRPLPRIRRECRSL